MSVFVLPPSIPELERRLHERAQDDYETIHRRMAKAADEMSHWAEYDYVVINRDLTQAFAEVSAILAAERLKRERQPGSIGLRPQPAGKDLGCQDDAADDFSGAEVIKGGRGLRERPLRNWRRFNVLGAHKLDQFTRFGQRAGCSPFDRHRF